MILEHSLNKVDIVIRDLAKKYNLPVPLVTEVVRFPYRLTKEAMENVNIDKPIYHLYLGRFVVKPKRLEILQAALSDDDPKKIKRDISGVEEPGVEGQGDREDSKGESTDMC